MRVWNKTILLLVWCHRNRRNVIGVNIQANHLFLKEKCPQIQWNTLSKFGVCLENFHEEKSIPISRIQYTENIQNCFQVSLKVSGKCFICVSKRWSARKKTAFWNMLWKINSAAIILFFPPPPCFFPLSLSSLSLSPSLSLLKISCHSDCICLQTCQTQWAAQANRIWQNPPNCWAQDVVLWPSARSTWTSSDFYLAVSLRFIWHSNYEC